MFLQLSKNMYLYILEVEMMIFMRYKINPYEMEKTMTILDLQSFITTLSNKIEENAKNQSKDGNKIMKSLIAIRDILNYMTLDDTAVR
jgi:hypothetical protein